MTKGHDFWTDQLSEYVDEALVDARLPRLEEHLAGCEACRALVEDLRRVKEAAGLLGDAQPARDLWPGIASAIAAAPREVDVIALPVGRRRTRAASGLFLTVRQLAAASVVLVSMSAAATWWAGVGMATRPGSGPIAGAASESAATLAADVAGPSPELAGELEVLEAALAQARERLDPSTVRIVERNMGVIQRAIDESLQALVVDPGNVFLKEHLERAYQEKIDFLREATSLADWEG
ncbi:MAG TPA: zf-HC2 domain-containing protein [Longimicrobiales bacterium]|nr:zf-HC2 domain-containing protein [Longimicrobiales bacterium]